jgi:hypothetical protein
LMWAWMDPAIKAQPGLLARAIYTSAQPFEDPSSPLCHRRRGWVAEEAATCPFSCVPWGRLGLFTNSTNKVCLQHIGELMLWSGVRIRFCTR